MKQVADVVSAMKDEIAGLCQSLVRISTVNPYSGDRDPAGETAGQEFLKPLLEALGAKTALFDCPDDIYDRTGVLGPRGRNFRGRPNLVGRLDFGGDGPTVVVNGHMDTVGIDNMPDALSGELRDGILYGRGTSDCKSGLTVGYSALKALLQTGADLRGTIIFQSVVDEECNGGGAGTLACLNAGYTGDVAVFLDGNNATLTMGCGGCLTADVFVEGQEGHAAAGTGVSAIEKGLVVKRAIDAFKARRETERPHCKVNLGIFHAGVHPAVVPGAARMSLNIVYDYAEAVASREQTGIYGGPQIRAEFEQAIRAVEAGDEWLQGHPSRIEWVKDLIPYDQDPQDQWVRRFDGAFRAATAREPVYDKMMAWSDAAHPAALFGMPTVLYGPGAEGTAHSSHERVPVANLVECTEVLATFLLRELGA
ncbi:MAG: M20/M25/M40 family metallo-hydrolase [Armatimonadia bacterium]